MVKFYVDYDLKSLNSFGVEARAARFVEFRSAADLKDIPLDSKWMVLSGGNNVLFTKDYPGLILHPTDKTIAVTSEDASSVAMKVGAGVEWDDLVRKCVSEGLWGVENLSLIPGYAGAAPVQNIGAYGAEAATVIESVEMVDAASGAMVTLARDHCGFGYRTSIFKTALAGKVIITAINIRLRREGAPCLGYGALREEVARRGEPTLRNIRDAVIAIRNSKLPDPKVLGNAGSFFRNPVVDAAAAGRIEKEYPGMPRYADPAGVKLAAGWLIEKAGWKGRRVGDAGVHKDQALVLVNYGSASGNEILALANHIIADVESQFGVRLTPEVNIL